MPLKEHPLMTNTTLLALIVSLFLKACPSQMSLEQTQLETEASELKCQSML